MLHARYRGFGGLEIVFVLLFVSSHTSLAASTGWISVIVLHML